MSQTILACWLIGAVYLVADTSQTIAQSPSASQTPAAARGVIRAVHQAVISTDLSVPVARTPVREGQTFARGAIILELDCRRPRAELDAASAVLREMKTNADSQALMIRHGAGGRNDLDIARARVDKADAERRAHETRLEQCRVVAPYDGVVMELAAREHETTTPGKPVMAIQATGQVEIDVIIDTTALKELKAGSIFQFRVDELAIIVPAQLDRVAGSADPVSRTIKLIAIPIGTTTGLLPGMSGTARFEPSSP